MLGEYYGQRSLVGYSPWPVSGAEIRAAPCLPALAVARLPVCLRCREGPVCSPLALLWYLLNPLFCNRPRLPVRAFCWKVLFFLVIPQFVLLSHVSSLRLSSGHSGLVLTLSMDDAGRTSLSNPHSLVANASLWATSPLVVVVRCLFGVCLFVCFSWLCCKTPHRPTCEMVTYCLETSPSQVPPQDRSPSLTLLSLF